MFNYHASTKRKRVNDLRCCSPVFTCSRFVLVCPLLLVRNHLTENALPLKERKGVGSDKLFANEWLLILTSYWTVAEILRKNQEVQEANQAVAIKITVADRCIDCSEVLSKHHKVREVDATVLVCISGQRRSLRCVDYNGFCRSAGNRSL